MGDDVKVPLSPDGYALVERSDLPLVRDISWSLSSKGYVQGKDDDGRSIYMHVAILGMRDGYSIDHINRDRTDNRRSNLRHATTSEQRLNQGVYRREGDIYRGKEGRWFAFVHDVALGPFDTAEEAMRAREARP